MASFHYFVAVVQSLRPIQLCNLMDCSKPGSSVLHCLPVCSNSSSQWHYLTILSSVTLFSSCPQSFPASGSFLMGQPFASGGQSIGASSSGLSMNIQGWFPSGLTGLISLQSEGLSSIFSKTTIWKHQFFSKVDYRRFTGFWILQDG